MRRLPANQPSSLGGRPPRWPPEHYWQRFWFDADHPSMPALCKELGVNRRTVYHHLWKHPEYDRLMARRQAQGFRDSDGRVRRPPGPRVDWAA